MSKAINHTKFICAVLCGTSSAIAQAPMPKAGFVPDVRTAIRVAEAILPPICGEECIDRQKPFHVGLINGIWIVSGKPPKVGVKGGGAVEVRINQHTGEIVSYVFSR